MKHAPLALLALALAGCISAPAPAPEAVGQQDADAPPGEALAFTDASLTLLALPVVGGEAQATYEVPEGATWLAASLKWATRGTTLELVATDPSGAERGEARTLAGSSPRAPARLDWWAPAPAPGTWTFTVRGQAALQEPLALQFHVLREPVEGMHVAEAAVVGERGSFVEVNMEMRAGQTVAWTWASDEPVRFDVHTHRDGETIYLVEETASDGRASFTAEEDGGYSLLWAPAGAAAGVPGVGQGARIPLTYRVDGGFALHSAVG